MLKQNFLSSLLSINYPHIYIVFAFLVYLLILSFSLYIYNFNTLPIYYVWSL